jgi:hypothetical protein
MKKAIEVLFSVRLISYAIWVVSVLFASHGIVAQKKTCPAETVTLNIPEYRHLLKCVAVRDKPMSFNHARKFCINQKHNLVTEDNVYSKTLLHLAHEEFSKRGRTLSNQCVWLSLFDSKYRIGLMGKEPTLENVPSSTKALRLCYMDLGK